MVTRKPWRESGKYVRSFLEFKFDEIKYKKEKNGPTVNPVFCTILVCINNFYVYNCPKRASFHRIKRVPDSIVAIPPLAYNCALYELKPSTSTGWSNEAYQLFRELILTKFGSFFVYPMNTDKTRIEVDVVWKEYIYPLSIRDTMFFLGYGSGSTRYYINEALVSGNR